ncbi:hypothetical protein [Amycolatopsis acidiphila]|uniref:Uncharacterized protein n=1 Tax=Amycolatopsis acidiphila TaxID=715473 RepID=A0A558A6P9_9PSEU|nr:hypothetical protein [Amycolatopsis acidiphila]TVT19937.1 hypothetical protein FNH06_22430 [Amycolatopsis acidiphila]GHG61518.1 hypothetical protein GCM10017788_16310 [Amycolatopsis acidiphila]
MTVDIGREIGIPVPAPRSAAHQPLLEPLDGLQWSQAIELPRDAAMATRPAEIRRAWIHRAPESEVLSLFRAVTASGEPIPSPWWLRALADGRLQSRADGFRVEDRTAQLLSRRPGWEYVPWAADGESGYWEFMPSERGRSGHRIPTTLLNTSRHSGWLDVLPAHSGTTPEPIAVAGLAGLRSRLGEFEAVR